jgi:hypothetical protein
LVHLGKVELRERPVVEDIEGLAVKRRSTTVNTRSFISSVSAVWADFDYASRRLIELQMGPKRQR